MSELDSPIPNEPHPTLPMRDVPVDWEALEDAFENNAPEVHSYLHLTTGEVLRVVDGIADPQMHGRISSDGNYLRVDPVSSREQYRWMERFLPMVLDELLKAKLGQAIDGKGAFRRFKDALMAHGPEREQWFTYRSERLRTFMESWLTAHAIRAVPRTVHDPRWDDEVATDSSSPALVDVESTKPPSGRRLRNAEASRQHLRDVLDVLGPKDLETLASFADFLRARKIARSFAHHHEQQQERVEGGSSLPSPGSSDDTEEPS